MAKKRTNNATIPFENRLVLNRWFLGLFGKERFQEISRSLASEESEGVVDNHTKYLEIVRTQITGLSEDQIIEYDANIVRHTERINEARRKCDEPVIVWKYFQYLSLLATEIYLDRYFADPNELRLSIDTAIAAFNEENEEQNRIEPFDSDRDPAEDLNKIAYWIATGGGKTLLMHIHFYQYLHYLKKYHGENSLNRIILLTPNEGLSAQHRLEFKRSGILADYFDKNGKITPLFSGERSVEIIDINKLKEDTGAKNKGVTVSVDSFEGNNLVFVDEGHRGMSSGDKGLWLGLRERLCEKGFSFEYSATFSQAIGTDKKLVTQYARSILFDYSYRWFYKDGFGKDYRILNIDESTGESSLRKYMTAGLLAFYEQLRFYDDEMASSAEKQNFLRYNIAKPLWVFVGSKVNTADSDVIKILAFLDRFVRNNKEETVREIGDISTNGLLTADNKDLFEGHFHYLHMLGLSADELFSDILRRLFHAPQSGRLYVENLKGAEGEIALKIGSDGEAFGIINVGDDSKLVAECDKNKILVSDRVFSDSMFRTINENDSPINLLIGSKKFTEGWNSWRVSTMGLMNVGQNEGAQIIQLFGRGIRLRGYDQKLKRSGFTDTASGQIKNIDILETLSIFGIDAQYMKNFREILQNDNIPTLEREVFFLPVVVNKPFAKLKILRLKKEINGIPTDFGNAFRKIAPIPAFAPPEGDSYLTRRGKTVLNWYPKIQSLTSRNDNGQNIDLNKTHFSSEHTKYFDIDRIYFKLEEYKAERKWFNFNLSRSAVAKLLKGTGSSNNWYDLLIPQSEMEFTSFEKVKIWENIAIELLKKYMERFYYFHKNTWEKPYLEYADLNENDPNFLYNKEYDQTGYRLLIDKSRADIVEKLRILEKEIRSKQFKQKNWKFEELVPIQFDNHLYQPLLYLKKGRSTILEICPVALNEGERRFVEDLRDFYESEKDKPDGIFQNKEFYLLRNLSRGKGVGFFEEGGFYPDFILWLLLRGKQYVTFIDPKGISHYAQNENKIHFCQKIKEIEKEIAKNNDEEKQSRSANIILNSAIISVTPSTDVVTKEVTKEYLATRNVFFQEEDKETYISSLFEHILKSIPCIDAENGIDR